MQIIRYLVFGMLTFFISIASYLFFVHTVIPKPTAANAASWTVAVMFAYFTNRKWVFNGKTGVKQETVYQFLHFIEARFLTLLAEEILIWLFIEQIGLPGLPVKTAAQGAVILLNYILSKLWIFKEDDSRIE